VRPRLVGGRVLWGEEGVDASGGRLGVEGREDVRSAVAVQIEDARLPGWSTGYRPVTMSGRPSPSTSATASAAPAE